jgi:membrane-associated phospholipid phosphatase
MAQPEPDPRPEAVPVDDVADSVLAEPLADPTPEAVRDVIVRFDDAVDDWWDAHVRGRPPVDRVYYLASQLGDFSLIWFIVGAAQGLRSDRDAKAFVRLAAVLGLESLAVNQGIKRLFRRPRPVIEDPHPHPVRKPLTSSFPSGHSSAAFTAAGLLASRDDPLTPLYLVAAAVVATSRIHTRMHHAADVVVGAGLGLGFAVVARRVWPLPNRR